MAVVRVPERGGELAWATTGPPVAIVSITTANSPIREAHGLDAFPVNAGCTAAIVRRRPRTKPGDEEPPGLGPGKKNRPRSPFFLVAFTIVAMSDLAGAAQRQSEAAFERLVHAETGRLYQLALAIVDEPHEAEDAVQDTLVTAWRRWSSLEGFSNPSAWLTRVCVRECLRRRRSFRRRQPWHWDRERFENETSIADIRVRLIDVHRAYQHLSPRQRAMVTLHHHDGYTVEQCAVFLGCSPGTARSHLGRAIAKLRKELADE